MITKCNGGRNKKADLRPQESTLRRRTDRRSAPTKRNWYQYQNGSIAFSKTVNTYLVARGHPLALGDERSGLLVDLGLGGGNLVLKKSRRVSNDSNCMVHSR